MKKFQPRALDFKPSDFIGRDMELLQQRMEMYDSMSPSERALVQHYGLKLGVEAARQFYGRWKLAWEYAEKQRQLLQVQRLRSIDLSGFAAATKRR
jgi:hypothetical protein